MTSSMWLAYVATVLVIMLVPGPSHLLMLSNSLNCGFRRATATAAGDLSANLLQMLGAGLGLAAIVTASAQTFFWIQWAGVAYLFWLAVQMLRRASTGEATGVTVSASRLWWQGFATSASNPKAIVFFAALFPQFIDTQAPLALQLSVLILTYLVIDGLFLLFYGAGAAWLSRGSRGVNSGWLRWVGGVALMAAALLLALKISPTE